MIETIAARPTGPTGYQVFLLVVLVLWPLVIAGLLFAMSRIESYVDRSDADTPQEAGLEPVTGRAREREVTIVFGDKVVGGPETKPEPVSSSDS
jgi:hypothetical protein